MFLYVGMLNYKIRELLTVVSVCSGWMHHIKEIAHTHPANSNVCHFFQRVAGRFGIFRRRKDSERLTHV